MKTILVQGASTAAGWYDMDHAGWANRLRFETLQASQDNPQEAVLLQNDAIPGNTLSAVLRDMSRVDKFQRLGNVTSILSIGLNESKIVRGTTYPLVSLARFHELLEMYGEYMSNRNAEVIYVGTELLLKGTIVTDNGNTFEDDLTAEYDALLRQQALSHGMQYIDTSKLLQQAGQFDSVCDDGHHPNSLGHAVIHYAVRGALENIGILKPNDEPEGMYPHQV